MKNLQTEDLVTVMVFATLLIGYFIFTIYNRQNKLKLADEQIRDYYREKGHDVQGISKLNMTERIKYGVPMSPYISFYYSPFRFLNPADQSICRSVESTDDSGKEYISFVEVSFSSRKGTSLKEFDIYEF